MSAYVSVEWRLKDETARLKYSAAAHATIIDMGGVVLASGPLTTLFGVDTYTHAVLVRFKDMETIHRWYNSAEYQSALPDRAEGMDARFIAYVGRDPD